MKPFPCDDCIRHRVTIDGESFYLMVGDNFLMATIPRENSVEQSKLRNTVEQICRAVTRVRGGTVLEDMEA